MLDAFIPCPAEIDSCLTRCGEPCLMTIVAAGNQRPSDRKRRRGAVEQEYSDATISQHLERRTISQLYQEANAAYYDSLSTVWLTRGAVAEHNRRNKNKANPVRTTAGRRRNLRDTKGVRQKTDIGEIVNQSLNPSKQLKHFARHGGPHLGDLRAAS